LAGASGSGESQEYERGTRGYGAVHKPTVLFSPGRRRNAPSFYKMSSDWRGADVDAKTDRAR
jgi:hypothetical protein